jgi:hypothetical protein
MQGVAVKFGEETGSSYLLPISVDGLIVVASVSLVELAGRIRFVEEQRQKAANPAPVQFVAPVTTPVFQPPVPQRGDYTAHEALNNLSEAPVSPAVGGRTSAPMTTPAPVSPVVSATTRPAPTYANGSSGVRAAVSTPTRQVVTAPAESTTPRQRRPVQETAELADEIEAMQPGISSAELARRLGISEVRLKAVRREASLARAAGSSTND